MKVNIDKDLVPMKAHYFLFNAGTAPVVPFMPQLATQLGYSSVVVGTMYMILPIIGLIAKPLFGYIADRYHQHRLLFLGGQALTAVAFFLIMFVPAVDQETQFHCHAGVSSIRYCSNYAADTEQQLETHFANRTLSCQMRCQMVPPMWDIVCNNWLQNKTQSCQTNSSKSWIDFDTYISMNDVIDEPMLNGKGRCLNFIIPHDRGVVDAQNVTLYCPKENDIFRPKCQMNCNDSYLEKMLPASRELNMSSAMAKPEFWFFFGMLIISWAGMAVVVSIGDAICFGLLGERHHLYGKQRLCGSLGWGVFAVIAGLLVDAMSKDGSDVKNYTIVFWMTLVILGFDMLASTKLKHTQTHMSSNIWKDVGQMFLSLRCVVFFLWCVAIGLGTALIWNFLFIYLEELAKPFDEGNYIKTLEGLVMGIQCFGGELPLFFLSGWILKRIGHVNAMSLVLFGFGVRFILYSMLQNPWYILPIELLNGVTFGLFYATMASYASIVAPPGTEATMQSLVGAIFEGVGVSIGSQIAGQLFDAVSARTTFEIFGIAAFIIFIIHVCVQMYLQRNVPYENGKGRSSTASAPASASASASPPTTVTNTANEMHTDSPTSPKNLDDFRDVDLS
ncbi:major facilitator superfamily domain-containing protein 6-A isoform X1 [Drosophila nasuta]|uniref:major facilitator superfamily domain-containing protein 6-A isoform X1 n=1 Tax=Drosophila nasuta TaxID=42062 RepID=UPI00295E8E24|nr:major facilitator superfamily domain-containing protein 6-A isoform X1 [Drosophila nasuta]